MTNSQNTTDFGLAGPGSVAVSTRDDPEQRAVVDAFLDKARQIRPLLRESQAETEQNGRYSADVHQYFIDNDFYKLFVPKRFGGYELSVSDVFLIVSELARGCASTAWCFCLGSAHALQLSSYWPAVVQEEIYGDTGYFIAPSSSTPRGITIERADGGYRVSGKWAYSSGAPYLTHFIATLQLPDRPADELFWAMIPAGEGLKVLDDWGSILGMKGSGSNTVEVTDVIVPDRYIVALDFRDELDGDTAGSRDLGNSLYAGPFNAFAVGEIAAITVGLGYAALDEYRRILATTNAPDAGAGHAMRRIDGPDWQRSFGLALAKVDSAAAISTQTARLYDAYARRSVEGVQPFTKDMTYRLRAANQTVQELIYEAVQLMLRGTGSSALRDGQRMQRYYRDITTAVTRTNQLDFVAYTSLVAMTELEEQVSSR